MPDRTACANPAPEGRLSRPTANLGARSRRSQANVPTAWPMARATSGVSCSPTVPRMSYSRKMAAGRFTRLALCQRPVGVGAWTGDGTGAVTGGAARARGRKPGEVVDSYIALAVAALGSEQGERGQRRERIRDQVEHEGGRAKARAGGNGDEQVPGVGDRRVRQHALDRPLGERD